MCAESEDAVILTVIAHKNKVNQVFLFLSHDFGITLVYRGCAQVTNLGFCQGCQCDIGKSPFPHLGHCAHSFWKLFDSSSFTCRRLSSFVCLQGEGDAAIAVWTHQEQGVITLTDSISSYILGGL